MKVQVTTHGVPRRPDSTSEDAFRVHEGDGRVVAVLADGLGSSKAGGAAARRAVDMLVDYYLSRPQSWSPRRALTEFASQINLLLHQESQALHGSPELLCTLSAVALEGGRLYGFNVGDSPVYLWHQGTLKQLSTAHTLAQPGMNHVLTRAIGLEPAVEATPFECDLADGDMVVLCSDGVSNALPPDKLSALLARRAAARTIVSAAAEAAAEDAELHDDSSAVVLEITQSNWSGAAAPRPLEVLPALRAGESIDNYRLVRSLQEGDRVWLAQRDDGARHVLKFPPLEARTDEVRADAFIRELWRAARIDSPDFARAITPAEGSLRYYAMEFIDAPTLRETLKRQPLRVEDAVELGRFLLRAGQSLVARDLVHGDIKPDNILVLGDTGSSRFQLIDFGSTAEVFSVTSRAGTPTYLAPERFHGGALSERTELFSIGVTLYEALTRTYPYGEVERFQTPRFDHPAKRPTRLNPAIPPWLEAILLRAITPDAAHRYQHFSEMAYDLDHPQTVVAYAPHDAPLLERDPLRFYKYLSFVLFLTVLVLTFLLLQR